MIRRLRIARRDKKGFLSDQGKEIEENNRMGKNRALFKKIRDTKRTFQSLIGTIKDRNDLNIQETKIMASGLITSWQMDGKQWKQWLTLFLGAPNSLQMVTIALKLKDTYFLLGRKAMTNLDSTLESKDFANKGPSSQSYVFFPVVIYGYESWTIKKAESQRINAFELWCCRRLESPLDFQEINPVNPKGNQS